MAWQMTVDPEINDPQSQFQLQSANIKKPTNL